MPRPQRSGRTSTSNVPCGIAYIDESQRDRRYLMAAMPVEPGSVARVRRELATLRPHSGRARLHFHKESDARRRKMISVLRSLPGVMALVADDRSDASFVDKRERCLSALVHRLIAAGVTRLVLDHADPAQATRDRQTLMRLTTGRDVTYAHEVAHTTEPMLWVPDAIAWCAGAKEAEWRTQLDGWVAVCRV